MFRARSGKGSALRRNTFLPITALLAASFASLASTAGLRPDVNPHDRVRSVTPQQPLDRAPVDPRLALRFEPNVGQSPEGTDYLARGPGYHVLLDAMGAQILLGGVEPADAAALASATQDREAVAAPAGWVQMHLVGADPDALGHAEGRRRGVSHYLRGSAPGGWQRHVPH